MKKLLIAVLLLSGCAAVKSGVKGGILGGTYGLAGIEYAQNRDTVVSGDLRNEKDKAFTLGSIGMANMGLSIGLFVINPIVGGVFVGVNAVYGSVLYIKKQREPKLNVYVR